MIIFWTACDVINFDDQAKRLDRDLLPDRDA